MSSNLGGNAATHNQIQRKVTQPSCIGLLGLGNIKVCMRPGILIKRLFPRSSARNVVRVSAYLPTDAYEFLSGKRKAVIPPRGMRFDGADNYIRMGTVGVNSLIELCDLQPHHSLLDVGCGTGRMALPLIEYFTTGSYEGFDIVPQWIDWSTKNITRWHPNLHFRFVDVYSRHYNSTGGVAARDFVFPYRDGEFDCALLMSIFTHMLPDGIERYIHELARVLRPGGKALITALLLNEKSLEGIDMGLSTFPLGHRLGTCRVVDNEFPETTIAIPESHLLSWFADAGLKAEISYGSWSGRSDCRGLHDDIVVEKSS